LDNIAIKFANKAEFLFFLYRIILIDDPG